MFFKRNTQNNTRPAVKKVSELVDSRSHKQKKYISLMLVPSYSTGKTRSLRVPRGVFHAVVISILAVSAVIAGFYLRSTHFERMASNLSDYLDETREEFADFQIVADQTERELRDTTQIYEHRLTEAELRAQTDLERQARRHQYALDDIWDHFDEVLRQVQELREDQDEFINNLGARIIIPPVAELLTQLETSRAELLSLSDLDRPNGALDLMVMGGGHAQVTEYDLIDRIILIKDELIIQRQLLTDLRNYSNLIQPYIDNYPTIWPVRGTISSGFGYRSNPMGGGNSEHHNGVDIPAPEGTPIRATGGGTVIFEGYRNGYGYTVKISHGIGISTMYTHNVSNSVIVGQQVQRGDIIAYVGSTGRSTAPHVHYEVHINGVAVCPVPFLKEHYTP